jgi:hypothetical protein
MTPCIVLAMASSMLEIMADLIRSGGRLKYSHPFKNSVHLRYCGESSREGWEERVKIMKKSGSHKVESSSHESASQLIDARIEELGDWRGEMLSRLRALIRKADPEVVEEWKWGIPVWSHDGIICTGESYKKAVKLTFAKGAFLDDPAGLFNSSLEGRLRRAIDFHEGDKVNEKALKDLIRVAAALNTSKG